MTATVVVRTFASVPQRSASATWDAIVELVAPSRHSASRRELEGIRGVASSCITDEVFSDDPLVVYGAGPRVRVYAIYGDDAIEGEGANESPLSFVPTDGDWKMSIPCTDEDLAWVQRSLRANSTRITARAQGETAPGDMEEDDRQSADKADTSTRLSVNRDAFFRR